MTRLDVISDLQTEVAWTPDPLLLGFKAVALLQAAGLSWVDLFSPVIVADHKARANVAVLALAAALDPDVGLPIDVEIRSIRAALMAQTAVNELHAASPAQLARLVADLCAPHLTDQGLARADAVLTEITLGNCGGR